MNFPDFSDFSKTLTEDEIAEISRKINSNVEITFSLDEKGLNSFATSFAAANLLMTTELLKRYHEWLKQQLS